MLYSNNVQNLNSRYPMFGVTQKMIKSDKFLGLKIHQYICQIFSFFHNPNIRYFKLKIYTLVEHNILVCHYKIIFQFFFFEILKCHSWTFQKTR
jgi:hypothetical protein